MRGSFRIFMIMSILLFFGVGVIASEQPSDPDTIPAHFFPNASHFAPQSNIHEDGELAGTEDVNSSPLILSLLPSSIVAGSSSFDLVVDGTNLPQDLISSGMRLPILLSISHNIS